MDNELQFMTLDQLVDYRNTIDEEIKKRHIALQKELFDELSAVIYKIKDKGYEVWYLDEELNVDCIEIE